MPSVTRPTAAGLIGNDLLMRSRLQSALPGVALLTAPIEPDAGAPGCLFVDLNTDADTRVPAIARWRTAFPDLVIVGFCGHEEAETRRQAMAAGATRVVTNGGLAAEARRVAEQLPQSSAHD